MMTTMSSSSSASSSSSSSGRHVQLLVVKAAAAAASILLLMLLPGDRIRVVSSFAVPRTPSSFSSTSSSAVTDTTTFRNGRRTTTTFWKKKHHHQRHHHHRRQRQEANAVSMDALANPLDLSQMEEEDGDEDMVGGGRGGSSSSGGASLISDAKTTAELLASIWDVIANASDLDRGEERVTLFPAMYKQLSSQTYLSRLLHHFDVCRDVCDTFGITTILRPHLDASDNNRVTGFTVKSYKSNKVDWEHGGGEVEEEDDTTGGYKFTPDPFWDEEYDPLSADPNLGKYDDDDEDDGDSSSESVGGASKEKQQQQPLPEIMNEVPSDDDEMISITKTWVSSLMSNMGICPFTSGAELAGLPMGQVYYTVDRLATTPEDVYSSYWKEVVRVEQCSDEKQLSTTLLILPEFALRNVEIFENLSFTLTQALEPLKIEDLAQLVFFHPQWSFRDGSDRGLEANAANYARRSPWPMINILRTKQVRAAQRGIPTGLVYTQNEKTLNGVGANELERMLRLRDWKGLDGYTVDRREYEALRVAQDLQVVTTTTGGGNGGGGDGKDGGTGVVVDENKDRTFEYDSTPAANKVDKSSIDGGDMVNVILEALSLRLGKKKKEDEDGSGDDGDGTTARSLTGAETSATLMAMDFLIEELDQV